MRLRPFFTYFGGKYRSTPTLYPKPACGVIVEPFAGSAGYALHYSDRKVILCDKDPIVAGIWQYLIQVSESEILALPDVEEGQTVDDMSCPQEAKWLAGFWMNKGVSSPRKRPSAWMRQGLSPTSWWGAAIRTRIASQLRHIRHWQVREGNYSLVGGHSATFFVDPPYQKAGSGYRFSGKDLDYQCLAEWCQAQRSQVIACENEGAEWLPFQFVGDIRAQTSRRSRESVWLHHVEAT